MSKKLTGLLFIFILGISTTFAKPVTQKTAQRVAENFYSATAKKEVKSSSLFYTEFSTLGKAVYYVFNINDTEGFVIVTADDLAEPVIGYSNEGSFVVPEKRTTIDNWLKKRSEEISFIVKNNSAAPEKIINQWSKYLDKNTNEKLIGNNTASTVSPLVQTKWNQSPGYNAMCPGGSVTGCVATAMAQIMRYWKYPAMGTGSSSYNSNYGPLSVNYGTSTYNWSNMPLVLSGSNGDIALINYHCGVSVEMDYSPSGSGAWVCEGDNAVCAENSYKAYFKYDPTTIQGLYRSNYDDATWTSILKGDLDIGRPIQYVGWDPAGGGHTWVCDGYDQNDFFHMNWGWGGSSNGYFGINSMNPSYNFSDGHEAVVGIIPIASNAVDAGIPMVTSPMGYYCSNSFNPAVTLQNFGANPLTSCVINYKLDNGSMQTLNWNGSLVFGQTESILLPAFTATAGTHTLTCYSSNPNGSTDLDGSNDQSVNVFGVSMGSVLPVVEGFETSTLPSADWAISHTATGNDWTVTGAASATGIKSAMVDNSTNVGGNKSILQTSSYYDVASYSSPSLTFKMAYQQKTSTTNDRLQVFVSLDCGTSWQSRWAHWGSTLPTVSGTASSFVPTPAQYTTYTVGLNPPVLASHHVLFRWEYTADINGPGNNIYLDDINIVNAVTGIQTTEASVNLNVYPNPSNGIVNVDFNLSEKHNISLNVTDVLGRTIETVDAKTYQAGEVSLSIGTKKNYEAGVYLVNINIDGQVITKKVLIN